MKIMFNSAVDSQNTTRAFCSRQTVIINDGLRITRKMQESVNNVPGITPKAKLLKQELLQIIDEIQNLVPKVSA